MAENPDNLWQVLRSEIDEVTRQEPALASYFHAAVLSHDTLESALAYSLAQLLGSEVVSSLSLYQVIEHGFAADARIGERMRRDLVAYYDRDPACDRYYMPLLYFKGFHALQAHRIAHWLWSDGRRPMALFIQSKVSEIFGVDIHPAAQIGGGIMIDHATGVVVGETAVIEDNVSMLHSVTLGGTGRETGDRHPKIRQGVLIATGAKILGNIEIGEGAKIGAGSLVIRTVPPHTTVAGVPGRVVGELLKTVPALDMDHRLNNGGEPR